MKNEYTTSEISLFGKIRKVTFQFLRLVESHYENLPFITDVIYNHQDREGVLRQSQAMKDKKGIYITEDISDKMVSTKLS